MSPAAFNLLEAIVRTTIMIADNTLTKDRAETIRSDLTGKLTSLKVVMQHEKDESLLQPMAQVILALGKHVLGRPVKVSDGDVSRKDLLGIVNDLARRSERQREVIEATLHPTGRCTCAGEGTCAWCQAHCIECGMALGEDGECPECYPAGEALAEEVLQEPGCAMCGCSRDAHNDPNASHRFMESQRDVVEKAPEVADDAAEIEAISLGLDPDQWRLIKDDAGDPVMALYFNGNKDSLSQEQVEEIEEAVLPIIRRWGR